MTKGKHIPEDSAQQPENHSSTAYHVPVMLLEAVEGLAIRKNGIYVDCTFGGGGHSREILRHLGEEGKLFVFDQDADVKQHVPADPRVVFIPHNFRHLQRFLRLHKVAQVDGILADLGVSSHQFDEADRGFSTRFDADMDMRMDMRQSLTAFNIISTYDEQRLHKIFEQYGEVTNAKTLAKTIVQIRQTVTLQTISNFKSALAGIVKGNPNRYFAQVFQALRIEVNDEFGALRDMLNQAPEVLKNGGRIVVITFHSLEDRIVKNFFKRGLFEENEEFSPFEQHTSQSRLRPLTKKPVSPGADELKKNARSRSARLRIAERV